MKAKDTSKRSWSEGNQDDQSLCDMAENFLSSDKASSQVTRTILALVGIGGIICVGAVMPGIIRAVKNIERISVKNPKSVAGIFYRMKRNGLVVIIKKPDGTARVALTEKGKKVLRSAVSDDIARPKKKIIWDRKWRVLIFDIPSEKSRVRDVFRKNIQRFGFYQMQKSVWVFPYPCEDEVVFLAKRCGIEDDIEVLTVKKLIYEERLRKVFQL